MRELIKKLWINIVELRIWLILATKCFTGASVERQPTSGSQTLLQNLRKCFWSHSTDSSSALDDATWDDLGLDSLYSHLDCNFSNFGASQMYHQLWLGGGGHVFHQRGPLQILAISTAQLREAFKPVISAELEAATNVLHKRLPGQTLNIRVALVQTLLIPVFVLLSVLHWVGLVALIGALVLNIWTHLKHQHDTTVKLTFLNTIRGVIITSSNIKAISFEANSDDSKFFPKLKKAIGCSGNCAGTTFPGKTLIQYLQPSRIFWTISFYAPSFLRTGRLA